MNFTTWLITDILVVTAILGMWYVLTPKLGDRYVLRLFASGAAGALIAFLVTPLSPLPYAEYIGPFVIIGFPMGLVFRIIYLMSKASPSS